MWLNNHRRGAVSVTGIFRVSGEFSVLGRSALGSFVSAQQLVRLGSVVSTFGFCSLGSQLSVLDFSATDSFLSIHGFSRFGSTLRVFSGVLLGSHLSVLSAGTLDSSPSHLLSMCQVRRLQ
jgi:hypothetical protein